MKRILLVILALLLTVEYTFAGPYKVTTDAAGKSQYTIVFPSSIKAVAEIEGPVPIIFFDSKGYAYDRNDLMKVLEYLASYGYLAIVDSQNDVNRSIDWLTNQNGTKKSAFYKSIDINKVAILTQESPVLNFLSLAPFDKPNSSHQTLLLASNNAPSAYNDAIERFKLTDNAAVTFAGSKVGNEEFWLPWGEQVSILARLWLDCVLKGHQENEVMFRFAQLPDGFDDWYMTSKNFQENEIVVLDPTKDKGDEHIDYDEFGQRMTVHAVSSPAIEVYKPMEGHSNGTSVLVFPGGGLFNLAWETELHVIANFLNSKGITVFGIKYRTRTDPKDQEAMNKAAKDAIDAMRYVKSNSARWNIDPEKIGWMGYSAGGMVQTAALMTLAEKEDMPLFLCSIYGPSGADIVVPKNAPKLFVSVHADHPNVFKLCQTLFTEWKAAGIDSEMHIWGYNTGGHFCLGKKDEDINTVRGSWKEPLYAWMIANGFVPRLDSFSKLNPTY